MSKEIQKKKKERYMKFVIKLFEQHNFLVGANAYYAEGMDEEFIKRYGIPLEQGEEAIHTVRILLQEQLQNNHKTHAKI